jgi:hypothetical protein
MTVGCIVYQRSKIPTVVSQRCDGPQKEWKMVNVHRLYRHEQVLSQERLPLSSELIKLLTL